MLENKIKLKLFNQLNEETTIQKQRLKKVFNS